MEPTIETSHKHFVNRVTPLSKALALALFVALPLLTLYVGYQAGTRTVDPGIGAQVSDAKEMSTPVVEFEQRELSSNEVHLSVSLPKDWVARSSSEAESPDYTLVPEDKYEPRILSGAQFVFFTGNKYADMTPAQFVEKEGAQDLNCSNCESRQAITIDGVPASQLLTSNFDGVIQTAIISLLKNGQEIKLIFTFDSYTAENQRILQEIIRTLHFKS